jgi:hypothetical protein
MNGGVPIRVLVCGGRNYADYHTVFEVLDGLHRSRGVSTIIQGGALGADRFAKRWADEHGVPQQEYPVPDADWKRHGKRAGPMRNKWMLTDGKPDLVIAFPGGRGTASMVNLARAAGVPVTEITE